MKLRPPLQLWLSLLCCALLGSQCYVPEDRPYPLPGICLYDPGHSSCLGGSKERLPLPDAAIWRDSQASDRPSAPAERAASDYASRPEQPPEPGQREGPTDAPLPQCGDGRCELPRENCLNCPGDCGCPAPQTCEQGQCKAPQDDCGDGRCDPTKGETCSSCAKDCGCPSGQTCQADTCKVCRCNPKEKRCSHDKLEQCTDDCLTWKLVDTCGVDRHLYCDSQNLRCECRKENQCSKKGDKRCSGSRELQTCTAKGPCLLWVSQSCPSSQTCMSDKCCECKPKSTRCNGQTYDQTCGSDCMWNSKRSCKKIHSLSICLTDRCLKPP